MNAGFGIDLAVLFGGLLLAVGVVASGLAARYRVPSLLLFVFIGMVVADDGLALVRFDDATLAQNIAAIALLVILFEGGLTTDPRAFRRVGPPAVLLATLGVVITAATVALAAMLLLDLSWNTALLLGSVVASTDAAAVFSALRGESLPRRVRELLQLESGLNDPIAVMLTVGLVEAWRADPSTIDWAAFALVQLGGGVIVGLAVGAVARWSILRFHAPAHTSFGVLTLAVAGLSYGLAAAVGASGFLAVYLTGVVIAGCRRPIRGLFDFHEGLAATAQAVLFLLLGLLVFPSDLVDDLGRAALLTAVLIFVARPLAVHALLVWFGIPLRHTMLVAWSGLRGAVPVVLATIPLTAGHPDGGLVFDVAFVVAIASVIVQAPAVAPMARRLGVRAEEPPSVVANLIPADTLDADVVELDLPAGARVAGLALAAAPLPAGARVVAVVRDHRTIVPHGDTVLAAGDRLVIVFPDGLELDELDRWATGRD